MLANYKGGKSGKSDLPVKSTPKKKASPKKKATTKKAAKAAHPKKKSACDEYTLAKPPPMSTDDRPVFILGKCKVYTSCPRNCWRVVPDYENYVNDVKFPWKDDPAAAWKELLEFCRKPKIPKGWKKIDKK